MENHKRKKILLPPGEPRYFWEEVAMELTLRDMEYLVVWEEVEKDIGS